MSRLRKTAEIELKKEPLFAGAREQGNSVEISNIMRDSPALIEFTVTEDGAADTAELAEEFVRMISRANLARHKQGMVQIGFRGTVNFYREVDFGKGCRSE